MIENVQYNFWVETPSTSPLLHSLPVEIQEQVLGELDYRSLCQLGQTCSQASEVAKANNLWCSLYCERWQDQPRADGRNWNEFFKERFVADRNWRNRTFKVRSSYNFSDTCQGTFFSALSNQDSILIKTYNQALLIPKTLFRERPYFHSAGNERDRVLRGEFARKRRRINAGPTRTLQCAGLNNEMHVLGWSDASLEFKFKEDRIKYSSRLLSAPKVMSVFQQNAIVGCQNGLLALSSNAEIVEEFRVNELDITQVGFLNGRDAVPRGVYFQNVYGQLYFSDLTKGFRSTKSLGIGVVKSELSADKTKLWIGASNTGLYLADPERTAEPIQFAREKSAIRCLHAQGNCVAVGTLNGKASLYDIRNSRVPLKVNDHDSAVTQVKIGDGKLFSGSFSGSLKVGFSDSTVASFEIVEPKDYAVTSIEIDPFMLFATLANGTIIKVDASFSSNVAFRPDSEDDFHFI